MNKLMMSEKEMSELINKSKKKKELNPDLFSVGDTTEPKIVAEPVREPVNQFERERRVEEPVVYPNYDREQDNYYRAEHVDHIPSNYNNRVAYSDRDNHYNVHNSINYSNNHSAMSDYNQDLNVALMQNETEELTLDTSIKELLGVSDMDSATLLILDDSKYPPITIGPIRDSEGKFGAKALEYQKNTKHSCFPIEVIGIPTDIEEVRGFTIAHIKGVPLLTYNNGIADMKKVEEFIALEIEMFKNGNLQRRRELIENKKFGSDKIYTVHMFNREELTYILSKMRNLNPKIVVNDTTGIMTLIITGRGTTKVEQINSLINDRVMALRENCKALHAGDTY